MKDYTNGFRHITVFGEEQEQKDKLDNFLKDNNYDHEETGDAVMVLTKEIIGTNEDTNNKLKTFMTRLSDKEALEAEISIYDNMAEQLDSTIDCIEVLQSTDDLVDEFNKGLELDKPHCQRGIY